MAIVPAGRRMSGCLFTSFGNGLIHALLTHVCWSRALNLSYDKDHSDVVSHQVDGDDNYHVLHHTLLGTKKTKTDQWEGLGFSSADTVAEGVQPRAASEGAHPTCLTKLAHAMESYGIDIHSSDSPGYHLHYDRTTMEFLSHTYEEVIMNSVAGQDVIKVLPIRPLSEMLGKRIFTIKNEAAEATGAVLEHRRRGTGTS